MKVREKYQLKWETYTFNPGRPHARTVLVRSPVREWPPSTVRGLQIHMSKYLDQSAEYFQEIGTEIGVSRRYGPTTSQKEGDTTVAVDEDGREIKRIPFLFLLLYLTRQDVCRDELTRLASAVSDGGFDSKTVDPAMSTMMIYGAIRPSGVYTKSDHNRPVMTYVATDHLADFWAQLPTVIPQAPKPFDLVIDAVNLEGHDRLEAVTEILHRALVVDGLSTREKIEEFLEAWSQKHRQLGIDSGITDKDQTHIKESKVEFIRLLASFYPEYLSQYGLPVITYPLFEP